MEFKIDFLKPGQAFPKDTPIYRLKRRIQRLQGRAGEHLIMKVGTSLTTLIISFSVLIFSSIFFYTSIYLPREKNLQDQTEEIQQMETLAKSLKKKRQKEQSRRSTIKNRIRQLITIKNESVSWTDKLRAINRNLTKGIWLTSLEVKQKALKPKQTVGDKKQKGRKRKAKKSKNKKGEKPKKKEKIPSQITVSISGATYAFLESKPLKLIARFMTNLMNDPVWEKHFDLTDWVITTSKAKRESTDKTKGKVTKKLKTVNFKLELERKR